MDNNQPFSTEIIEKINKCVDKNFTPPKNFIVPFAYSVMVKKEEQQEIITESGLILGQGKARNTVTPNIGIVYAVGPKCPEYIKPGLRVYFNQNNDLEYWVSGGFYHMCHIDELYGAIPDNVLVSMDTKSDKEIAREDGLIRESGYQERKKAHDENIEDRLKELAKKGFKA